MLRESIYRVDGYGHRAEAGYLQMKEDGKTVKEVDGYGHEKPGKLVVKEDGKVYRYDGYGNRAEAGYLQVKGDKIYKDDGYGNKTLVGKVRRRKSNCGGLPLRSKHSNNDNGTRQAAVQGLSPRTNRPDDVRFWRSAATLGKIWESEEPESLSPSADF